jgi:hypothetical protein
MVYRVVFDSIFVKQDVCRSTLDLLGSLSDVALSDLRLSLSFCPPGTDISATPREIFRVDPLFRLAVIQLESICFYTNPIDTLNCVHQAMNLADTAAAVYSGQKSLSFAFEVSFLLFLSVLLASDVPELDAITRFADTYSRNVKLGVALDRAKSSLVASVLYCEDLIAKGRSRGS